MSRGTAHNLQPRTDHDGMSRRLAVLACKTAIRTTLQAELESNFRLQKGDIEGSASYRLWSGMNRVSQDRMWSLLAEQVDRDQARIDRDAAALLERPIGTLATDDAVVIPNYQTKTAIHGQPGGYMLRRDNLDIAAGILYEAGGNIYALGQGIGKRDSKGERLVAHIKQRYPDFRPRRILEMGCSAGGQSTDYPPAFPHAEFVAIDLSPGMLAYAHARAEALGCKVDFRQQDAANTSFPDQHFDLIVSHNLFHEVAAEHMPAILKECHRLLAPGGLCIHQDVPIQTERLDAFQRFLSEWQTDNNDEPFWMDFANADLSAMLSQAGFESSNIETEYLRALDGPIPWYVVTAVR